MVDTTQSEPVETPEEEAKDVVDSPAEPTTATKPKAKTKKPKAAKPKAEDGPKKVTIKKISHYRDEAAKHGWAGDWRELGALNGVRNGIFTIDAGTTIIIFPNATPAYDERLAALKSKKKS
jgi:hypothetical protein